ncbi:MAG: NAD-dependent succinate-semialdehyde dehydrogenase [Methanosarcinales archaeon]|nr:NAD-dependent succinate-semialdehyde dehydrogenase [Methanosarcinales archaeon]
MYQTMMLIDGEQVKSLSGRTAVIRNPANQEPVGQVFLGGREEARAALEAAERAFPAWAATSPAARGKILHRAADLVRERQEDLARLLTLEQGKPLKESRREIQASADVLDYYAEEGRRIFGELVPSASAGSRSLVIRQPVGVAALITPWNFPVDLMSWKLAPALAAGCTVVAKPPSLAPLAATAFVQTAHDAGAPPGVVNVVHGPGGQVGAELVENPISKKIAFTGESSTGRWIMEHAARHLKRLSLELGGHAPFIVCKDAHLDRAVEACLRRAFNNMGQICISVNRVYVAEEVAEEFTNRLVEQTQRLKVGDGLDPGVDLGPMFSQQQREKTREHIADALEKGARLLCGGREPEGKEYEKGFFFLPTVLDHVDHSMLVMQEETFGPVAPIMTFQTVDQALELANDSPYGLAAYIFTSDLSTAFLAAERLEAGGVGVNVNNVAEIQAPFGGWKQSGFGRELSHYGLEQYLEIKHIRLGI